MSFYRTRIFPWIVDWALGRKEVGKLRGELLAPIAGRVLEIGFGTGLNLPFYPSSLKNLTILDPNPGMLARARARTQKFPIAIESHQLAGERLPFADQSFDAVVSTFTLCSIPGLNQALAELRRVLRPKGRFYFLEHGLSREPRVQRWQRRLTPLQRWGCDGCHLDRDIAHEIQAAGFAFLELKQFYFPKTPKILGYLSMGVAEPLFLPKQPE